jgi:hypothetical protein
MQGLAVIRRIDLTLPRKRGILPVSIKKPYLSYQTGGQAVCCTGAAPVKSMKIARTWIVPPLLVALLLALNCPAQIIGQAPSMPVFNPQFKAVTGPGYLHPVQTNNCATLGDCANSSSVWITNESGVISNGHAVLNFTIAGGTNGVAYDVFGTTSISDGPTNATWFWMGQGFPNVTYSVPTLADQTIYIMLGTPQDSDGDGLTDDYEILVSHSNPSSSNSINPGTLDGWAVLENLNPTTIYDQQQFPTAPHVRLDYWRFNTNTFQSESGLLPLTSQYVDLVPDWSGTALEVPNFAGWLSYPVTGPDGPSFNPDNGTLRFWFMPYHSSGTANGSGAFGTFFYYGVSSNSWVFKMQDNETQLSMGTSGGPFCQFYEPQYVPFQVQSNLWYQFTVAYSPSNLAVYTNGALFATSYLSPQSNATAMVFNLGDGVYYNPSAASQAAGFSFGNNNYAFGSGTILGLMDEVETFNYPLTPQAVAAGFPEFAGASNNIMTDSDYDGRSDMLEQLVDGTDPHNPASVMPCRLGYWRFDAANFLSEQGQFPLSDNDISLVPSWSGMALNINSDPASQITYWDVCTNGWANFNCRQGSLRFWFKPNWTGHPLASAPLFYMGNANPASSHWSLNVNAQGQIVFSTASNHVSSTLLTSAPLPLDSSHWMQIVLDYGPDGSWLYANGSLAAAGGPVVLYPALADRNLGFVMGNNTAYTNSINGQFDEIETFNYELSASDISSNFQIVATVDSDLDGVPDLLEDSVLPVSRPFLGNPVVITGAIEAEQFDLGGPGVGYFSMGKNPPSSYRPSGLFITNCDDLGLGYCLDQTRAGDWAQYTINVLVAQTYNIETRVAGLGTNGVFECEFSGNGFYTNTGPLSIPGTQWTNVSHPVYLTNGIYTMKLRCLANGSDGRHVGRFNYISIYPWWKTGFASAYTNTVTAAQLNTNNDWLDASNNAAVIQHAVDTLPAAGGTVLLPAGTYFVAQPSPNETLDAAPNAAVAIVTNNIEIAGAGKTNTTLIGYNRATTIFSFGRSAAKFQQCSNFVLRDLTAESQPHLAVKNVTNTVFELGELIGAPYTGCLVFLTGPYPFGNAENILVSNCLFLYGASSVTPQGGVSNCMVTHCDMIVWGGSNVYSGQVSSPPAPNSTNYYGSVGMFVSETPDFNLVVTDNTYNGNTNLAPSPGNPAGYVATNDVSLMGPDGFVYFQGGGNFFVARNIISNNNFEGVQFNSGPNAVVGNTFQTLINNPSTCALALTSSGTGGATGLPLANYSTTVVGNYIAGGRNAEWPQGANKLVNSILFSGNEVIIYPPVPGDLPGAMAGFMICDNMAVTGNTLISAGSGTSFGGQCGSAIIMNNDFSGATYRGIGLGEYGGSLQIAQIFNNKISEGSSFHVQSPVTNSFGWFLEKNVFVNGTGKQVPPFLDPPGSAIHLSN